MFRAHTTCPPCCFSNTPDTYSSHWGFCPRKERSPGTLFPTCLHGSPYSRYSDGGLNTSSLQRPPRSLTQSRGSPISPCPMLCLQASFAMTPCPCLVYSGFKCFHNFIYWLPWICVAVHGLCLVAANGGNSLAVVCRLLLLPSMDSRALGCQ